MQNFPRWQLMESAPKDGTHILTCSPKHNIAETWWKQLISPKEEYYWGGDGWSYASWQHPIYWMPCPEKPIDCE